MNQSKRSALKGLALGSVWATPVIHCAVLPAHAQTSVFTQSQSFEHTGEINDVTMADQTLVFTLGGAVPTGDGTVTVSDLAGDLGESDEMWNLILGEEQIGQTNNTSNGSDCYTAPGSVFNVSVSLLLSAIQGDTIVIEAENDNGNIDTFCGPDAEDDTSDGPESNRMTVTLSFPTG